MILSFLFQKYFKISFMRFLWFFCCHLFDPSNFCISVVAVVACREGTIMVACNMPMNFCHLGNSWECFVHLEWQKPNQNPPPSYSIRKRGENPNNPQITWKYFALKLIWPSSKDFGLVFFFLNQSLPFQLKFHPRLFSLIFIQPLGRVNLL